MEVYGDNKRPRVTAMIGIPTEKKIDSTIDHPRVLDEHISIPSITPERENVIITVARVETVKCVATRRPGFHHSTSRYGSAKPDRYGLRLLSEE
jgi:hypothetical protein